MALTGYTKVCGRRSSGVKNLHLAEMPNITSFTLGEGVNSYATATMVSEKYFWAYQFDQDTCELKESSTVNDTGIYMCSQEIEFHLDKMSLTERDAVQEIINASACGLCAIVEDNNGIKWVVGYDEDQLKTRPLTLKTAEATTGKKINDSSGETVKLGRETTEKMRTFTGTVPVTP